MTDHTKLNDLQGLVAIVTGASSGLGHRFAQVLHGAGATVVVAARRVDRLEKLAESLGERSLAIACDVAVSAERETLVQTTIEHFGQLDVLINNAGIATSAAAEDETLDDFHRSLEVNLVAPFHLSQLAARQMFTQGSGSIVNIASMLGLVAAAPITETSYCAAKGGLINLTRQLAAEWAGRGVRVNALAPGWFESEMTQEMWTDERTTQWVKRGTPVRRQGREGELDGALLLLAGPSGSFIHGHTLVIDGGWTAR